MPVKMEEEETVVVDLPLISTSVKAEQESNVASTSYLPSSSTTTSAPQIAAPQLTAPPDSSNNTTDAQELTGGMLDALTVAQDPTVFTPQGRIVFKRSDGDPEYRPPNVEVPRASEVEVNYYHIFSREEQKWVSWSKLIAQKLAVDYFGLSPKAPNGKDWALQDFPEEYYFTEQRKGPRKTYRTDAYLFGSAAHRFRSTMEFLPHAFWLLCDPSMNTDNCRCKYCSTGTRASGGGKSTVQLKKPSKPVGQSEASKATAYRGVKNNYKIRAQPSPREHQLPGVPLAIYSSKERIDELEAVETKSFGTCEGFRVGEIAYYRLRDPIIYEEDDQYQITAWPVLIEGVTFQVDVDRSNAGSTNRDSFDLQGRVRQKRMYQVVFMPSHEEAKVDQDRLIPGLMFSLPTNLRELSLGNTSDHSWIQTKTSPELNLENGKRRPKFIQMAFCYLYAVDIFRNLRLYYTATDSFTRTEMGRKAISNLASADASENGTHSNNSQAPRLSDQRGARTEVERVVGNGGMNRFMQSTVQNNYMDLDNDDQSSRRRAALRRSAPTLPTSDPSSSATNQLITSLDNNTYWQGLLFGLERIWVGDLVRLRLSVEDIETMITSLAAGNDLYNAEDRTKPDLSSPCVLRIKAIYRVAKAEVLSTDDKIRVAGDVFRVIDLNEAKNAKSTSIGSSARGKGSNHNSNNGPDDDGEVVAVEGTVKTEGNQGSAIASNKEQKSTKRPTFEVPFRPFLEKAYEDRLPMTPTLPTGYGFQRVNQSSVEVVCSVQQLAGRLWCSFAKEEDYNLANTERQKPFLAHEDSKDPIRIRLSLTGLVAGAVKAMEVHMNEGHLVNRDRAISIASAFALESRLKKLKKSGAEGEGEEEIIEDAGEEQMEQMEVDNVEAEEANNGMVEEREKRVLEEDGGKEEETVRTKKRVRIDETVSSDQVNNGVEQISTSHTTTIVPSPSVHSIPSSSTITPSKSAMANKSIVTPTVAQNLPSRSGEETSRGNGETSKGNEGTSKGNEETSKGNVETSKGSGESSKGNGETSRQSSPPLPENWIKRTSRKGQGSYYANTKTKETTWDRPKA